MSHSLSRVFVHLVWATKLRRPWIAPTLEDRVHALVRDQCRRLRSQVVAVGTADDHLHLLVRLHVDVALASLVRGCKSASAATLRRETGLAEIEWQTGYGAMSVDGARVPNVASYVRDQRRRHAEGLIDAELESSERVDAKSRS